MTFFTYFLPILTALLLLVFFFTLPNLRTCALPGEAPPPAKGGRRRRLAEEDRSRVLSRRDALPILVVTLLYALTAFFRLGSTADPQTFVPMEGQTAVFTLPEGAFPTRILLYPGAGMGGYELAFSEDGEQYVHAEDFRQDHIAVLKWAFLSPSPEMMPRYLRIRCTYGTPWLGEVVVLDEDGQPMSVRCSIPQLCDEQDTAPESSNFQNSSYFDEIYHARTAWEQLNGVWPYEITHPPLGKLIIGLGITLFGMTPFGWRFSGTLFGVLMLPLLYVFLKKLFGGRRIPTLGTVLFAADFMHYVQTRIATIDTYAVFFILLMYLFLYIWLTEDKLWALALCGISFGLGAASKWTSIYAGAGLAVLWAAKWIWRFVQAHKRPVGADALGGPRSRSKPGHFEERKPSSRIPLLFSLLGSLLFVVAFYLIATHVDWHITFYVGGGIALLGLVFVLVWALRKRRDSKTKDDVLPPFLLNVLFCLVFFIAVPLLIYYFSYLPYGRAAGYSPFSRDYAAMVWHNQVYMFTYHSQSVLGATHPYSSTWYQWLIDYRPILYVLEYPSDATKISIAAWLNPVLCWGGLLSLPVLFWMGIVRRDRRALFILVGYLSQLLPWVPVARLTFAYHYFPSGLFLVLGLSYVLCLLRENRDEWTPAAYSLVGGSVLLFVLFFPALNGLEVSRKLASELLKWLPTWPL